MPAEKGKLVFRPTPHCCNAPLGNGWPVITCKICGTQYNADDLLQSMLEYSGGAKQLSGVRRR